MFNREAAKTELAETAQAFLDAMAAEEHVVTLDPSTPLPVAQIALLKAAMLRQTAIERFRLMCARLAVGLKGP